MNDPADTPPDDGTHNRETRLPEVAGPRANPGEGGEPATVPRPGSARPAPGTPSRIGRFEIKQVLGEGQFGFVYLASDAKLDRQVAIKVPQRVGLTDEFRERFLREARAIAKIHHPNVCPVYEAGQDGDVPFIVMRFVAGGTLADLLKKEACFVPRLAVLNARKLARDGGGTRAGCDPPGSEAGERAV